MLANFHVFVINEMYRQIILQLHVNMDKTINNEFNNHLGISNVYKFVRNIIRLMRIAIGTYIYIYSVKMYSLPILNHTSIKTL